MVKINTSERIIDGHHKPYAVSSADILYRLFECSPGCGFRGFGIIQC
jgi:hypothetical protein